MLPFELKGWQQLARPVFVAQSTYNGDGVRGDEWEARRMSGGVPRENEIRSDAAGYGGIDGD